MYGVIYKIINKIDNKVYVGQTTQSLQKRWAAHKSDAHKHSYPLYSAIKKYGIENFEIKVVVKCNNIEELNEREIFVIKILNSLSPNGYNLGLGGNQKGKYTEETKRKISLMGKGRKLSQEHKDKIRASRVGKKSSPWIVAKIAAKNSGKIRSEATRQKMSNAQTGKKQSKETIAKRLESRKKCTMVKA